MYAVTNPATGELIAQYPTATDIEVRNAIDRLQAEYGRWSRQTIEARAAVLHRAADIFDDRAGQLADIITEEMGKRREEGVGEIGIVSAIFRYYADGAQQMLRDEDLKIQGGAAIIQKRPVGPLLGIMPWNYPYYQVARFAAPNLVLGNVILLKHAPNCPRSSAAIEQLLRDAGLPADAYINIYASNEQVVTILEDPRIQGVSVTGSERAGRAVAEVAGRNLKKVVLELGGSDPMVVLDTNDVDQLAQTAFMSRMGNTGQACNAPKRIIVTPKHYEQFVARVTALAKDFRAGDPADPTTSLAPLSSVAAADRLMEQIESAKQDGATIRAGGIRIDRPGAYVAPTVLTDIAEGSRADIEEMFGPVISIYEAKDEADAVRLANNTPYGLGASVFSDDPDRARSVAGQIEAGMVFINAAGGSQADLPFGGIKRSGIGRELGPLGIEEFMNKCVIKL